MISINENNMQTPTPEETLTTVESQTQNTPETTEQPEQIATTNKIPIPTATPSGPGQQTESLLHYTAESPTQIPTESPTQTPIDTPPVETPPKREGDGGKRTETTPTGGGGVNMDPSTTTPIATTPPLGCPDYPPPVFQGPFVGYEAISSQSTTVTWTRTGNTWSTTGEFPCGISFYMSMTCDPVEQKFYYDIGCSCCSGAPEWEFPPNGVSDTPLILPGELSKAKAMFAMGNCPTSCFNPGPNRRGGLSPGVVPNAKPVLLTINWNPDPNDSSTNGGSATFNIPNGVAFAAEGIVQ